MIIPKNSAFLYYNVDFHIMIDIHSKYDNMHKNGMFYALIYINNHIITFINFILLERKGSDRESEKTNERKRGADVWMREALLFPETFFSCTF